jgi:hypothetical protein
MEYSVDQHVTMLHTWHCELRICIMESYLLILSILLTGALKCYITASMHSHANVPLVLLTAACTLEWSEMLHMLLD